MVSCAKKPCSKPGFFFVKVSQKNLVFVEGFSMFFFVNFGCHPKSRQHPHPTFASVETRTEEGGNGIAATARLEKMKREHKAKFRCATAKNYFFGKCASRIVVVTEGNRKNGGVTDWTKELTTE